MQVIHYAHAHWTHTQCGRKVTSGVTVCSRRESVTCLACRNG